MNTKYAYFLKVQGASEIYCILVHVKTIEVTQQVLKISHFLTPVSRHVNSPFSF